MMPKFCRSNKHAGGLHGIPQLNWEIKTKSGMVKSNLHLTKEKSFRPSKNSSTSTWLLPSWHFHSTERQSCWVFPYFFRTDETCRVIEAELRYRVVETEPMHLLRWSPKHRKLLVGSGHWLQPPQRHKTSDLYLNESDKPSVFVDLDTSKYIEERILLIFFPASEVFMGPPHTSNSWWVMPPSAFLSSLKGSQKNCDAGKMSPVGSEDQWFNLLINGVSWVYNLLINGVYWGYNLLTMVSKYVIISVWMGYIEVITHCS